jgi:UDP-N-acetyl-2-amino-2-deoxyglucuronate dehydrogenase
MQTVRFGLVGAGAIAPSHITGIRKTQRAELAAICVRREAQKQELEERHKIPCFTSLEDMLDSGLIDAVSIITPSGLHLDPALRAAEAGVPVLVEKPLYTTVEGIDRMIEAARKNNVKLGCTFQARFRDVPQRVKRLIEAGALGHIYSGCAYHKAYRTQEYYDSAGWRGTMEIDGGGCLMNQGSHTVDLLLWNMGKVKSVIAMAETAGRERIDVETLAFILMEYESGAKGTIESTTLAYPGVPPHIEIFGSRGTISFDSKRVIRLDLLDPTPEEERLRADLLRYTEESSAETTQKGGAPGDRAGTVVTSEDMGHGRVVEDFVHAILNDGEPLVSGEEARRSVELITTAYESAKRGSAQIRL